MKPYSPPYLIQRIERTSNHAEVPVGLAAKYQANQPRTPEEKAFVNSLMPLDYMGSSEFEFGAFGQAIDIVRANRTDYKRFKMTLTGRPDNSWHKDFPVKQTTVELFGFAHKDHVEQVKSDVTVFVADQFAGRTKERVCLHEIFGVVHSTYYGEDGKRLRKPRLTLEESDHTAWFDLDNAWMVGSSFGQMDRIAELLGIPV